MVHSLSIDEQPVLIIDCQTTGANPTQGDLLEIAWCIANASGPLKAIEHHILQQPEERPLPKRIQTLTGIVESDLLGAAPADIVRHSILHTLAQLESPAYCIAHYARFEKLFLQQLLADTQAKELPFELLCTFEIAKRLYPNLPSKGIRAVSGFFGTTCGELKRAESHVESTISIWKNLAPQLSRIGIKSLAQIRNWLVESPIPKRSKFEYPLDRSVRLKLPDSPGVYRMLSKSGTILYVGKACSLKNRVNSYFRGQRGKDSKTKELLSQVWDLQCTVCQSPLEPRFFETDEIKRWDPPYNRALKRRQRELQFYSTDFSSSNTQQDENHPLGPFASKQVLDPLLKLNESLKSDEFLPDLFHYELPKVLLSEGFALFCIEEGVERCSLNSARAVLALGMWLLRRQRHQERAEERALRTAMEAELAAQAERDTADELSENSEARSELIDEPDENEGAVPDRTDIFGPFHSFVTSEDVGAKYGRMLRRIASDYLRSKLLTKMLHSRITFTHKDVARNLSIRNGTVYEQQEDFTPPNAPWTGLGIDTYDRMSVLLSEVKRAKGTLESTLNAGDNENEALLQQRPAIRIS